MFSSPWWLLLIKYFHDFGVVLLSASPHWGREVLLSSLSLLSPLLPRLEWCCFSPLLLWDGAASLRLLWVVLLARLLPC